jgi:hypothetical protein
MKIGAKECEIEGNGGVGAARRGIFKISYGSATFFALAMFRLESFYIFFKEEL